MTVHQKGRPRCEATCKKPECHVKGKCAFKFRVDFTNVAAPIKHYLTCSPNYPEKSKGERWRATTDVDLEDGTFARTCNDCGAFVIVQGDQIWREFDQRVKKYGRGMRRFRGPRMVGKDYHRPILVTDSHWDIPPWEE